MPKLLNNSPRKYEATSNASDMPYVMSSDSLSYISIHLWLTAGIRV